MIFTHLLFPTPVFTSYYESKKELQEYFSSLEYREVDKAYIKNFGESSKNTYVLNDPICDDLKNFITNISTEIMKNALSIRTDGASLTQSWLSVKSKHQAHGIHNHPNSILSGVYYYDTYDKTVEPLIIHKNNFTTTYELQVENIPNNNPISSDSFTITPADGLIVLFPSYVKHSVGMNISETPRKCLAFNLVTKDGFGSRGGFSELNISAWL